MREPRHVGLARAARIAGSAVALACLATGEARPGIPATREIVEAADITAVSAWRTPGGSEVAERVSALLVADAASGSVYYFESTSAPSAAVSPAELRPLLDLGSPSAIAHSDWGACAWDAKPGALTCFGLFGEPPRRVWSGEPFRAPTRLAVSPDGLLAIVDPEAGGLFWFAPPELPDAKSVYADAQREPFRVPELADLEPVAIAFLSWDTLAVLDRARDSIVTVKFVFDGYRLAVRDRRDLPVGERGRLGSLRSLSAQDGVLYVADESQVFVYLEGEGRLLPAVPRREGHGEIRQVAASYHDLFLLDGQHIDRFPRSVPVDLTLEGHPDVDQSALIDLYLYLHHRGLLETRPAMAREAYASVEAFLLAEGVLIVPPRVYRADGMARDEVRRRRDESKTWSASERKLDELGDLVCELNPSFCERRTGSRLAQPVPAGTRLELPALAMQTRLRRREVELAGFAPEWYLDRMVFSEKHRGKSANDHFRRLNPDPAAVKASGRANLPFEAWFATVAVPVADLDRDDSELRRLVARHAGVGIYTRAAYTQQMSKSGQDPPDPVAAAALCDELRQERRKWLESMRYPFCRTDDLREKALFPPIETARVSIGVLEKQSQLRRNHQVFELDAQNPAWYEPVDFDLIAPSVPASAGGSSQLVEDRTTYSRDLHHATHVSALLGGRTGSCWSGILPRSKLVLVDVDSPGGVRDRLLSAMAAGVRAFNVSQELTNSRSSDLERDGIQRLITEEAAGAIFVVAAGNEGKDFNTSASEQLPAGLGQKANVVTVTAVNPAQALLGPFVGSNNETIQGANSGKVYVDLAAPGVDVVSATQANHHYGAATGTSQAAPTVAAAAAYLVDEFEGADQEPGEVKARLLATADWNPGLEGKVWGGLFNFEDAVRYPERNLLHTVTGGEAKLFSLVARGNPKIRVTNQPRYYERGAGLAPIVRHSELRLHWILSLKRRDDGTHRIVFRDPDDRRLYILLDARLEGAIECATYERLNESTLAFEPRPQDCAPSLALDQIQEYVAGMPYHVEW